MECCCIARVCITVEECVVVFVSLLRGCVGIKVGSSGCPPLGWTAEVPLAHGSFCAM